MTHEQSIERHQKMNGFINDDVDLLKAYDFSIGSGKHLDKESNVTLIRRQ